MKPQKWLPGLLMPFYLLLLALLLQVVPGFLLPLARAQTPATGLAVGDRVPDLPVRQLMNYPTPSARLSDFRGKLLLLEFGATWCPGCGQSFPQLQALQEAFPGQVQVLFVTRENRETLEAFQAKQEKRGKAPFTLATAVSDTTIRTLFPHRLIPHIAWIGPDGTVAAVTSSDDVTAGNIRRVLSGKSLDLHVKHDVDTSRPLYSSAYLPQDSLLHYAILLRGNISSLGGGYSYTRLEEQGPAHGIAAYNKTLLELYGRVARDLLPGYHRKLLLLQVQDSTQLLPPANSTAADVWRRGHVYSYNLVVVPAEADRLYPYMLADLNRFSPYEGSVLRRKVKCLVLRRKGKQDLLASKGGTPRNVLAVPGEHFLRNGSMAHLIGRLNDEEGPTLPVLDETGYTGKIDITLAGPIHHLPFLRRQLQRYGLELVEKKRELDLFLLRDRPAGTRASSQGGRLPVSASF